MANLNLSTFLGNIQWKFVKQMKNSVFHSQSHHTTVTTNFFEIQVLLTGIQFDPSMKCFPSILGMANPNKLHFWAMVSARLSNKWKTVISTVIFIIPLSLLTFLKSKFCLQESIWNQEWSGFPSFGYGKFKTFFGSVQWKIVKQFKNCDLKSDDHNTSVTTILFEI